VSAPVLYFTVGLPGSGKTHYAKWLRTLHSPGKVMTISRDGLRDEYFGTRDGLIGDQEVMITSLQHAQIRRALERGITVIVHDCNLRMQYRKQLAQIAEDMGFKWVQVDLTHISLETCLERNAKRGNPVPEEVIRNMFDRYIKANKGEAMALPQPKAKAALPKREMYVPDTSKPKAVIVDIDGTVALHEGVRGVYDTSKYHLDKPNLPIIDMVRHEAYDLGNKILFTSGRHVNFFGVTEDWLYQEVKVPIEGQFMRENHGVSDDIEKLDLFDKYIRHNYNVVRAYDDRNRVVKAWRSIGLTCLQVAEGDF